MSGGDGLQLTPEPERRPRGRPKGSGNKRRGDLAAYIAAQAGSTPGEQMAKVAMVSRKELRAAGGDLVAALVAKAKRLARELDCKPAEAWAMLARERSELMAYVHQRQPQAVAVTATGMAPSVLIVGSEGGPVHYVAELEAEDGEGELIQGVIEGEAIEVSRPKSHGHSLPLLEQGVSPGRAAAEE